MGHMADPRRGGPGKGVLQGTTLYVAALLLLFVMYNMSASIRARHSLQTQNLHMSPVSSSSAASFSSSSSSSSRGSSSSGDSILQALLAELRQLPGSDLAEQHILPLTNVSGLSHAQLPILLQGTNFTQLTTADILDAAGSLASRQKWQLAWLHQRMFCSAQLDQDQRHLAGAKQVPQGNFSIFVYSDRDIVSRFLAGESHSYEGPEVDAVIWALHQFNSSGQRALAGPGGPHAPLMVDVGANVGTFMFKVADAGFRVAAFEAMPANIALLRHSLCANPRLAERVALFGTALGPEATTCWVISDDNNQGDGHTVCDAQELAARTTNTGYSVRGAMSVRRLDSIIAEDVQVMKMDVEGFELAVLEGAQALLSRQRVWYIVAECTFGGEARQRKFLRFMDTMGYYVSIDSFHGPFLEPEAIRNGSSKLPWNNIYCIRKDLRDAAGAGGAGQAT